MLYCQPLSFYNEMKYISTNRSDFMQKIGLSHFHIPEDIEFVEPIQYLIKMVMSEPFVEEEKTNRIFALRTYGTNNGLVHRYGDQMAQTYFALIDRGNLFVARDTSYIKVEVDGIIHYTESDEYGDEYEFSLDDIALKRYDNVYDIRSYLRYHPDIFAPINLLPHLV